MERLSIFDIFKIGVGPSSSHTLGPWKAANQFASDLKELNFDSIKINLYGSLSKTGIGHGTNIAVMLGLEGHRPETIETEKINDYIFQIKSAQKLKVADRDIKFIPSEDIIFQKHALDFHPNALTFQAFLHDNQILEDTYYSIGGGFITKGNEDNEAMEEIILPYPIDKGVELLRHVRLSGLQIHEIVYNNELIFRSDEVIRTKILNLFDTMLKCIYRGCHTDGILPGGLKVIRRAKPLHDQLLQGAVYNSMEEWVSAIKSSPKDFNSISKWVSCFALAVNEENAAFGRIVTSPTNGAAGVIPAVLMYYYCFCDYKDEQDIIKFMLTSGEIGCIFKKGATISAAVGGCQAEIGVSSAMAAGGLTQLLGGTPKQVLMAAEIAMEHHLGLTCDPIGGLVQVPCIERNAMGAIKAITASNLALSSNPANAIVNFDVIVKTMWDTAQDMNTKYKETAEGGLAINLPVILPNC